MANIVDVNFLSGSDNPGGLGRTAIVIPIDQIASIPEAAQPDPTIVAPLADYVTASGKLRLKPNAKVYRVYTTNEKNGYKAESIGERDGKSLANTVEIFHPGSGVEAAGLQRLLSNGAFIVVFRDLKGGRRMLGTKLFPAYVDKNSFDHGQKVEDLSGFSYSMTSKGATACLFLPDGVEQLLSTSSSATSAIDLFEA